MDRLPVMPALLLVLLALASCGGTANTSRRIALDPDIQVLIAANTGPDGYSERIIESLDDIARYNGILVVEIRENRAKSRDPIIPNVFRETAKRGIETWIWPLFGEDKGTYANDSNGEAFLTLSREIVDWLETEGIRSPWLLVDMEPSEQWVGSALSGLSSGNFDVASSTLLSGIDPKGFSAAAHPYRELVDWAHGRGMSVHVTTVPFVVDDLGDGDDTLQDIFGVPITPVEWDEISLMAYRTVFRDMMGGATFSPYLVSDYSTALRARYGDRASVIVGLVGHDPYTGMPGYDTESDLAADIGAAAAAGIRRVGIFSLHGMLNRGGIRPWLDIVALDRTLPSPDTWTPVIRGFFASLDRLDSAERGTAVRPDPTR